MAKIHKHLFQDISTYAGSVRNYGLRKGETRFVSYEELTYDFKHRIPKQIKKLDEVRSDEKKYIKEFSSLHTMLDEAHPFREGNGRATRIFLAQVAKGHDYKSDQTKITSTQEEWIQACKSAINSDDTQKQKIFKKSLLKRIKC